jgi:hypothetical protein
VIRTLMDSRSLSRNAIESSDSFCNIRRPHCESELPGHVLNGDCVYKWTSGLVARFQGHWAKIAMGSLSILRESTTAVAASAARIFYKPIGAPQAASKRHGGAVPMGRWRPKRAFRLLPTSQPHNAHVGPWAVSGGSAGPGVEPENGPRQRSLDGSPMVVRTL